MKILLTIFLTVFISACLIKLAMEMTEEPVVVVVQPKTTAQEEDSLDRLRKVRIQQLFILNKACYELESNLDMELQSVRMLMIEKELVGLEGYVDQLLKDGTINHYTHGTIMTKINRCYDLKNKPILSKNR
jgi:hypothetical protein